MIFNKIIEIDPPEAKIMHFIREILFWTRNLNFESAVAREFEAWNEIGKVIHFVYKLKHSTYF